ncbi:MAG: helix-turn-helix domain-containing protein [Alphaproteobacteria bacterium]|nr:helix-turn-helix domain-containing protein [Alphaproteobacteria bacterium]MBU0796189.1 helix-turn-helix domain-containing protein [Alphaproteobacteria bacterium]MBU0887195.1 helix-turn-helix domain-containing protein [Alphaproteobacteria bacterium]MBU1812277.1 helix-turn-helix domain-containing protein [Alphaproteobacteria bacterium]MBU2090282.1 helix-turn-helix domain-containing protein [Alphaproteobacteria bacterium]
MKTYGIREIAREAGCNEQTVRWYEEQGLLPPVTRSAGGQRRYSDRHRQHLAFLRHGRELGFSLDAIRELLTLYQTPQDSCAAADEIAARQLAETRHKIARLQALEAELSRMVASCDGANIAECRVIETLADHSHAHCLSEGHGLSQGHAAEAQLNP